MFERIQVDRVSAEIVVEVGHIAPVSFDLGNGVMAEPYSLPGWTPEECQVDVPAIKWLRGEFFGFPFGPGKDGGPVHGSAANGPWSVIGQSENSVRLKVELDGLGGSLEKCIELRNGERALYLEHTVKGVDGRYNYGHHPVLEIPEGETVDIRLNPFSFGGVYPEPFGAGEKGDINLLKEGGRFKSLDAVPLRDGGTLSVASYPTPVQHEDLVMMSARSDVRLGWTAVSFDGYVWLALRSVEQFPSTLFWLSNGGCYQEPWNGVNGRRIGIEDVCSYYSLGADASAEEPLSEHGVRTSRVFSSEDAVVLRHAQLVHPTNGKCPVASVMPVEGESKVRVTFENGEQDLVNFDWQWLLEPDQ